MIHVYLTEEELVAIAELLNASQCSGSLAHVREKVASEIDNLQQIHQTLRMPLKKLFQDCQYRQIFGDDGAIPTISLESLNRPHLSSRFSAGDRVAHKLSRTAPKIGTVLALDDPRVWANTLKFPEASPAPEKVREHVVACREHGLLRDTMPVLWDDGSIYWHRPEILKAFVSVQGNESKDFSQFSYE